VKHVAEYFLNLVAVHFFYRRSGMGDHFMVESKFSQ
jgi:hypothetical protein